MHGKMNPKEEKVIDKNSKENLRKESDNMVQANQQAELSSVILTESCSEPHVATFCHCGLLTFTVENVSLPPRTQHVEEEERNEVGQQRFDRMRRRKVVAAKQRERQGSLISPCTSRVSPRR